MNDHLCLHEADIAVLKDAVPEMKEDIKKVLKILQGNGKDGGLVTDVSNQGQSVKRLWAFVTPIGLIVLAGVIKIFFL